MNTTRTRRTHRGGRSPSARERLSARRPRMMAGGPSDAGRSERFALPTRGSRWILATCSDCIARGFHSFDCAGCNGTTHELITVEVGAF